MKFTYNTNYFYPDDVLYQLSKNYKGPVMYIESTGIKNCLDEDRKNEVWEFYYDKCDNVILSGLRQRGEVYCYFLTNEQALEAFNDWFPQKSALTEEEMDFYFYARIVNAESGLDVVNGV